MITQDLVRRLFVYNKNSGVLSRRIDKHTAKKGDICGATVGRGYLATRINGALYPNHRIIYLYCYGFLPEQVDHINNIKKDNRIKNLRACTNHQNSLNKKIKSNNTSGIKGVYWGANVKKWRTEVTFEGVTHNCGSYSNKKEAEKAVRSKREELHREYVNHG